MLLLPYRLLPRMHWPTLTITDKVEIALGYVSDMATEWWTDKDWEEHWQHVQRLKREGRFGKLETYTVISKWCTPFDGDPEKAYDRMGYRLPPDPNPKPMFSNFRMMFLDTTGYEPPKGGVSGVKYPALPDECDPFRSV